MKTRIRLNSTNSVNSVNMDNKVAVELQQTTKPLIYTSLKDDVDQYEVFLQERNLCNKYRLICTINPYCTNILFNPVTEIIKENVNKYEYITDESIASIDNDNVYGKKKNVNRADMIRNTEYSREDIGYIYYPGTDIFNNHLLRNKSFKIVNPLKSKNTTNDDFNTIRDFARTYDGKNIEFFNRFGDNAANPTAKPKHLYEYDDIMNITDSINNNLMEENGWFGFVNKTTILAKSKSNDSNTKWEDEDYNHVINNRESCEFIDLYPDRTLFSFNPKYNDILKRPEYNWKYCLTYPYENFYNHKLIKDKNGDENYINALFINDVKFGINGYGEYVLFFNTLCKHNLKAGSIINLYFKSGNDKYDVIKNVNIRNIGDMDLNNNDYCFYVNANMLNSLNNKDINDLYENIYENETSTNEIINSINNILSKFVFRFKQVINGYESEYYIRIFHKLPNLMKNEKQLTIEKANNTIILDDDFLCNKEFNSEQYPLAFSSTIYNDKKTQITFTDGIDIENLLDNRGRPVSEIFLTIIKNNKGNKEWYEANGSIDMNDVEYSHCFSEVSCGFDLKYDNINSPNCSDIKTITFVNKNPANDTFGWVNISDISVVNNITETNNKFIGDLVEFNIGNCNEIVLEDCFFRFNTYLREHILDFQSKYHFNYDDLISDDYDVVGFEVKSTQYPVKPHKEGYYYKAHYNIKLKEYGDKIQDSHYELKIKDVYLDSFGEDVCLFIQTSLPHRLNLGEIVMFFDDEREQMLQAKVLYIKNIATFAIGSIGQLTCHNLMRILKGEFTEITFKLRRYNTDIPFYAEKVPHRNIYMWRELNGVGNLNNTSLPEYTFNNGYLYINQDINFYLRRQDPFDETGLYYYGESDSVVPNDVYGNTLQTNNYEYKTEAETTC